MFCLRSHEANRLRLQDRFDAAQCLQHLIGDLAIDLHYGHGL